MSPTTATRQCDNNIPDSAVGTGIEAFAGVLVVSKWFQCRGREPKRRTGMIENGLLRARQVKLTVVLYLSNRLASQSDGLIYSPPDVETIPRSYYCRLHHRGH